MQRIKMPGLCYNKGALCTALKIYTKYKNKRVNGCILDLFADFYYSNLLFSSMLLLEKSFTENSFHS